MMRHKEPPEGQKQDKLFGFMGMETPVPPPKVDPVHDPEFQRGYVLPSYSDLQPNADEAEWNDMVREAYKIVDPQNLRFHFDVIVGYLSWVLVCPKCNSTLEPVPTSRREPEGKVVFEQDPFFHPTFVYCQKCQMSYFMVELVKDRSFRLKLPTDKITLVVDFLKGRM